ELRAAVMTIHTRARCLAAITLLALSIATPASTVAASLPAGLGPEGGLAQPSGGYVGRIAVAPAHGPIWTLVGVTAEELPAEQEFDLVWTTVKGSWKVANAEYHGREYSRAAYRIATVKTDAAGRASASFTAPEDFGFLHDIVLQRQGRLFTQTAF